VVSYDHGSATTETSLGSIDEPHPPPFIAQPHPIQSKYAKTTADCSNATIAYVDVKPDSEGDGTGKILFGAAITVERLDEALQRLAYFIGGTKASMIALVPPADNLEAKEIYFCSRGLDISLVPCYLSPVRAFNAYVRDIRPETEWMIIMDDKTFFPSLSLVLERLSTLPSLKPHWIGAVSEASWQVRNFGRIGFGSVGIVLSRNVVKTLEMYWGGSWRLGHTRRSAPWKMHQQNLAQAQAYYVE
jgi:hypothetical protein